jgi:formylglycine-generating enzyme required for sulfatase activity
MRLRNLSHLLACLSLPAASLFAQAQVLLTIFPDEDPLTPADYRLVWPTLPGQRYEVRQSSDLQTWAVVPGFPAVATGSRWDLPFLAENARRFFQVLTLDDNPPAPPGMALIPAGEFQMGDTFNEGSSVEHPVHSVFVSAFYMDEFEVTTELWDEVYTWAVAHGYSFDNSGSGNAAKHLVDTISWHDAVKWCNARSEKEGLTPCYYTDAAQTLIYKTDKVDLANNAVKWTANGYRLPTESEWEKAARGGLQGKRFPWGDTISHSQANYYSSAFDAYDISPTRGYHPEYAVDAFPYTSPVGSFAANGYGLFDLAGNVGEWCWDGYGGPYPSGSQVDPRGPAFVSDRVLRGGDWLNGANFLRCAFRSYAAPTNAYAVVGFRCVRGL